MAKITRLPLLRRLRRREAKQKVKWWHRHFARDSFLARLVIPPLFVILITVLLIVVLFPWFHGKGHG